MTAVEDPAAEDDMLEENASVQLPENEVETEALVGPKQTVLSMFL